MSKVIECFWLEPTEIGRSGLRRYESGSTCPMAAGAYHNASVYIGEVAFAFGENRYHGYGRDDVPHDAPQWPVACACGFAFRDTDNWQHNVQRLFTGAPDGTLYTTRNMPPGAMYDMGDWGEKGPDGIALAVILPGQSGFWLPDSPSASGGAWTRTGTIPKVTCSPSILTSDYHGWLRNGKLEEC